MTEEQPRPVQRNEKDEKGDEKQQEKVPEKNFDEKWRRDPLSAVIWALILIWVGVAILISNLNLTAVLPVLSKMTVWPLIFGGAGVILLLEVLIRLIVPAYRGPVIGTIILALVFLGVGFGELVNFWILGAVLIIIIGVLLLFRGFRNQ